MTGAFSGKYKSAVQALQAAAIPTPQNGDLQAFYVAVANVIGLQIPPGEAGSVRESKHALRAFERTGRLPRIATRPLTQANQRRHDSPPVAQTLRPKYEPPGEAMQFVFRSDRPAFCYHVGNVHGTLCRMQNSAAFKTIDATSSAPPNARKLCKVCKQIRDKGEEREPKPNAPAVARPATKKPKKDATAKAASKKARYKVYKITNDLNDKVYIGVTNDEQRRFRQHCAGVKTANMGKAIKLLGAEHFKIEVIATTDSLFEAYYVLEPYYIGVFQSIERGYNGQLRNARPLFYHTMENSFAALVKRQARERNVASKARAPDAEQDAALADLEREMREWERAAWERFE